MARQNIQFKGLRHSPSDITGQDGDLLECVNLIHENGEMKPIEMPERTEIKGVYNNETLVAVHNLTDGKKFVFAVWNTVTTTIHVKDANNTVVFTRGIPREEIQWAETIGNTLIIGTDKSTHYALYKNGAYKWLGDKLPQPVFEFKMADQADGENLSQEVKEPYAICTTNYENEGVLVGSGDGFALNFVYEALDNGVRRYFATQRADLLDSTDTPMGLQTEVSQESKKILRDNFASKLAVLTANARKEGKFIFPFMARYAVRMYDGKYVMHSAPVILLPSALKNPIMALVEHYKNAEYAVSQQWTAFVGNIVLKGIAKAMKLSFVGFVDEDGNDVTDGIGDYKDIISGVDLFLSSEVRTVNERYYDNVDNFPVLWYSGLYEYSNVLGFYRRTSVEAERMDYGAAYAGNMKESLYDNFVADGFDIDKNYYSSEPNYRVQYLTHFFIPVESYSEEETMNKLRETNMFYLVKRYDLDQLTGMAGEERYLHDEIEYGLFERLETLPTLTDDYVSRSRIAGRASYNYNQRLIMGGISLQAPRWYGDVNRYDSGDRMSVTMYFVIEKPEKTIVVKWDSRNSGGVNDIGMKDFGHYLYYPDPDCKEVIVKLGNDQWRRVPMHEHTGLHGAYALMEGLESLQERRQDFAAATEPQESADLYYQLQNTIAMSGVANPFYFPASNFKDIGRARVIGIAANVLDTSYNQWGPFPLYAFCSDGIVAVTIDKEGKFSGPVEAVSADVLREPTGLSRPTLVQANRVLVFLTQRGVMCISGTQPQALSLAMEGRHFNPMNELSGIDYGVGAFQNLVVRASDNTSFREYAKSGFLAYDYTHNRVLLVRADRDYQYVLSMDTMLWSKQVVYSNREKVQIDMVPGNTLPEQRSGLPILQVKPMVAAVNDYTELYLQDADGWLYKTMDVAGENDVKQVYQYGYFVSRPVRFGTDEYKTLVRVLHRYTHYAGNSFVKMALYGSRDGVKYGRINSLRGMSYQYFIFVIYTYLKPNERYSYMSVDFETRLTNKLR